MNVILNIIYFLLGLTVLVSIHEAGHLSMAKLFDVYCEEYAIGFGPKIISIPPKGMNVKKNRPKETTFSIRAIPLGGFVSMAGEGMEDVEELKAIPANRFLTGVKKWQRAIIMVAGVTLNAILGLILLICAFTINTTPDYTKDSFKVTDKLSYKYYDDEGKLQTKTYSSHLGEGSVIIDSETSIKNVVIEYTGALLTQKYATAVIDGESYHFIPSTKDGEYITYEEKVKKTNEVLVYYVGKDYFGNEVKFLDSTIVKDSSSILVKPIEAEYSYDITKGTFDEVGGTYAFMNEEGNGLKPLSPLDTKTYVFSLADGTIKAVTVNSYASEKITKDGVTTYNYSWELVGISVHGRHYTFGEVMTNSFKMYGQYATAIYSALAKIFTKEGFSSLGGPVAIVQQQMTFVDMGFGYYLLFWGLISINLAVINLLPFPGLDGWHFLVVIIEGITKKEINPKVKAIMSTVGMILLFALMAAITLKDVIGLIF